MIELPVLLVVLYVLLLAAVSYLERRERKRRQRAEGRFEAARRGLLRVQEASGDEKLVLSYLRQTWQEIREIEE